MVKDPGPEGPRHAPALAEDVQLRFEAGGERLFVTFAPVGRLDWIVGTVVPESAFLLRTEQNTRNLGQYFKSGSTKAFAGTRLW